MATHGSAALESHAAPQGFIRKWIFSLDHKVIGLQYYFLALAAEIGLRPKVTVFSLDQANEALMAVKNDAIDGAAVIVP